jgi:hypothetical protein
MRFLKDLIRNLIIVVAFGIILYLMFPSIFGSAFSFDWVLFGPLLIVMVILFALPRKRRRS